jgi:hypothetical protein
VVDIMTENCWAILRGVVEPLCRGFGGGCLVMEKFWAEILIERLAAGLGGALCWRWEMVCTAFVGLGFDCPGFC